jgi:hypothetical protein
LPESDDISAIKVPGSEEVRELPETQAERDAMPLQYRPSLCGELLNCLVRSHQHAKDQ